jgi:tetratricopeptide (TPR) repeat protein
VVARILGLEPERLRSRNEFSKTLALVAELATLDPELADCRAAIEDRYFHKGKLMTAADARQTTPIDLYRLNDQSLGFYVDGERVDIPFLHEDASIEQILENSSKWERVGYLDNAVTYSVLALEKAAENNVVQLRMAHLREVLGPHFSAIEDLIGKYGPRSHLCDRILEEMTARAPTASPSVLINDLETVVALRPRDNTYRLQLADTRFINKDFERALSDYGIAQQGDPDSETLIRALVGAGNSYAELGKTDDACVCFHRALESDPKRAYAWTNLAICLVRGGRAAEAVAALQDALKTDAQNAEYWFLYAAAYRALGDNSRVAEGAAMAVKLAPNQPKYLMAQAQLDFEMKRYRDAIEHYTRALDAGANEEHARYERARSFVALGDRSAAVPDLEIVANLRGSLSSDAVKFLEILKKPRE